jgi:hypothetical protein
MYNILLDGLPTEYKGHKLRTSYKVGILITELLEDDSIEEDYKQYQAITLLYEDIPEDVTEALNGLQWYLSLGKSEWHFIEGTKEAEVTEKSLDFTQDQFTIVSGFKRLYGIDLLKEDIHYWLFMSLLSDMGENALQGSKMSYRCMSLKDLKGDMKKHYAEIKDSFKVRGMMSEEEYKEMIAEREKNIQQSPFFQGEHTRKLLGM